MTWSTPRVLFAVSPKNGDSGLVEIRCAIHFGVGFCSFKLNLRLLCHFTHVFSALSLVKPEIKTKAVFSALRSSAGLYLTPRLSRMACPGFRPTLPSTLPAAILFSDYRKGFSSHSSASHMVRVCFLLNCFHLPQWHRFDWRLMEHARMMHAGSWLSVGCLRTQLFSQSIDIPPLVYKQLIDSHVFFSQIEDIVAEFLFRLPEFNSEVLGRVCSAADLDAGTFKVSLSLLPTRRI